MGVLVMSDTQKERECTIVEANKTDVLVHFNGFKDKFDEWLAKTSSRILQLISAAPKEADESRGVWAGGRGSNGRDRSTSIPRMDKDRDRGGNSSSGAGGSGDMMG